MIKKICWIVLNTVALLLAACHSSPSSTLAMHATATPILVFGDSLSAGYGMEESQRWSVLLEQRLKEENVLRANQYIANESISGETTSGGLKRFPKALEDNNPQIVILELGANDALRRQSLKEMEANLREMIALSQRSGATVVLVGVEPPLLLRLVGGGTALREAYKRVSETPDIVFVPDLFDRLSSSDMQDDRLHPKDTAQQKMMETVYPAVLEVLEQ